MIALKRSMSSITSAAPLSPAAARSSRVAPRASSVERGQHPGQRVEARTPLELVAGLGERLAQPRDLAGRAPELDLVHHDRRERLEQPQLPRGEAARPGVHAGEQAEHVAVVGAERHPDVEVEPEGARHQRMLLGARIGSWRFPRSRALVRHGRSAEPRQAAHLALGQRSVHRLVPDAVRVDEADDRDRHLEHLGGERGDPVEHALRRRVEDRVAPEHVQPIELRRRVEAHPRPP